MGERMWRRTVNELFWYRTELEAHVTLTHQRRIRIRALHSREERPIRVLHARLSPRTRFLRFLSPIPTCPMGWYAVSHAWTTHVSRSSLKMRPPVVPG